MNYIINTEKEIYEFILSKLSDGESILIDHNSIFEHFKNTGLYPDAYLPNGCKLLGFPKCSIIEIKYILKPGSIRHVLDSLMLYNSKYNSKSFKLYLIYKESNGINTSRLTTFDNVECLSVEELLNKCDDLNLELGINKDNQVQDTLSQAFIQDLARSKFRTVPVTFFLGAGVSCSANLPKWDALLGKLIDNLNCKNNSKFTSKDYENIFKECGNSSIITGRFIQRLYAESDLKLEDSLYDILYDPDNNHNSFTIQTICELISKNRDRVNSVITYNYDDLIERGLLSIGVPNYSVCDNNEPRNEFPVIHVHGVLDIGKSMDSTIVLSELEYHDIYRRSYHWSNVEQLHALQRTSCFFIGLSMDDPNLRRLLDIVQGENNSKEGNRGNMMHFAYIEKNTVGDKLVGKEDEFRKQYEQMLAELGVYVIWYEGYNNLPNELKKLI